MWKESGFKGELKWNCSINQILLHSTGRVRGNQNHYHQICSTIKHFCLGAFYQEVQTQVEMKKANKESNQKNMIMSKGIHRK